MQITPAEIIREAKAMVETEITKAVSGGYPEYVMIFSIRPASPSNM